MATQTKPAEFTLTGTTPVAVLTGEASKRKTLIAAAVVNLDTVERTFTWTKVTSGGNLAFEVMAAVPAGERRQLQHIPTVDAAGESITVETDATATTTEPKGDGTYREES